MACKDKKYDTNVSGRFYVDKECIACDACVLTAIGNFIMEPDTGHAYVSKQPETPEEENLCLEAMSGCPVEAIGNDGSE